MMRTINLIPGKIYKHRASNDTWRALLRVTEYSMNRKDKAYFLCGKTQASIFKEPVVRRSAWWLDRHPTVWVELLAADKPNGRHVRLPDEMFDTGFNPNLVSTVERNSMVAALARFRKLEGKHKYEVRTTDEGIWQEVRPEDLPAFLGWDMTFPALDRAIKEGARPL